MFRFNLPVNIANMMHVFGEAMLARNSETTEGNKKLESEPVQVSDKNPNLKMYLRFQSHSRSDGGEGLLDCYFNCFQRGG